MTLPTSILESAFELSPPGMIQLFRLSLAGGTIFRMCPERQVTWLGNVYDALPCGMSDLKTEADGKVNRPSFTFANPEGLFTSAIGQGLLENATLTRYLVLTTDLDANNPFSIESTWKILQVLSLQRKLVVVQCREPHDMPAFVLPARAFYPPEFPHVRL